MLCNALRPPGLNARRTSSFAPRLRPERDLVGPGCTRKPTRSATQCRRPGDLAPSSQGGVAIGGAVREPWNQGQPFTLRDVLIAGFYHRRIIIFFALLPLLVGGIAVVETKTNYTASDLLMVLVNREFSGIQNVTDSGPAVLSIEGLKSVELEIQIIESAETICTTITTIGLERIFPDTSVIEQIRGLFSRVVHGVVAAGGPWFGRAVLPTCQW